jgi:NADPH:quinone reductase-like Zn-dependent oxidoreductase
MKAIYFEKHGDASVLEYGDLPNPKPRENEALIKVKACALNHLDIWVRRGWEGLQLNLPHIGGSDIVGEVIEINGKSSAKVGDNVMVYPGFCTREDSWTRAGLHCLSPSFNVIGEHCPGGLAEYVCVPSANLFPLPAKRSFESVAASILVGLTTWRMLFTQGQCKPGQRVLVVGAGGGVNLMSILFAQALGASVHVIAGGAEKCEALKKLGITDVIDYKLEKNWHRKFLQDTKGYGADIVIDNVGQATFESSLKAAARGGKLLTVGNTSGSRISFDNRLVFTKQISIIGSTMGNIQDLLSAQEFIAKHEINIPIDQIADLKDGIGLIEKMEKGLQFGKLVIKVSA